MKFGRIVPLVNTHRLTESYFEIALSFNLISKHMTISKSIQIKTLCILILGRLG